MIELLTNIGIIAGALLGLGVIWSKGVKPLYRAARRMGEVHNYILVELPTWQKSVDTSLKQLYPNSGSSIHDKVTQTNRRVEETGIQIEEVRIMLENHLNDRDMHKTGPNPIVSINMTPDTHH